MQRRLKQRKRRAKRTMHKLIGVDEQKAYSVGISQSIGMYHLGIS